MADAFELQLARANAGLKSVAARVSIVRRRHSLVLQATLPERAGTGLQG